MYTRYQDLAAIQAHRFRTVEPTPRTASRRLRLVGLLMNLVQPRTERTPQAAPQKRLAGGAG